MEKSEKIETLLKALNVFQADQSPITKDCKNPFLRNKYAGLDTIIDQTKENLHKNGLSISQFVTNEGVNTYLFHESGQYISSGFKKIDAQISKGLSIAQAEGVAITYTKRYQLSGILGISTDEDTDGQYSDNKQLNETKQPEKQSPSLADAIREMKNCVSIDQVKICWSKYPKYQTHETFILTKDNLKEQLIKSAK